MTRTGKQTKQTKPHTHWTASILRQTGQRYTERNKDDPSTCEEQSVQKKGFHSKCSCSLRDYINKIKSSLPALIDYRSLSVFQNNIQLYIQQHNRKLVLAVMSSKSVSNARGYAFHVGPLRICCKISRLKCGFWKRFSCLQISLSAVIGPAGLP